MRFALFKEVTKRRRKHKRRKLNAGGGVPRGDDDDDSDEDGEGDGETDGEGEDDPMEEERNKRMPDPPRRGARASTRARTADGENESQETMADETLADAMGLEKDLDEPIEDGLPEHRLTLFRQRMGDVMAYLRDNETDTLDNVIERVNRGLEPQHIFSTKEATAGLKRMENDNQVFVSGDMVFLV